MKFRSFSRVAVGLAVGRKNLSPQQLGFAAVLVISLATIVLSIGARAYNREASIRAAHSKLPAVVEVARPTSSHTLQERLSSTSAQAQISLMQTVRVFIHPEDIYPGSVVVRPGRINLVVENETLTDVSLVVELLNPGQSPQGIALVRTPARLKRSPRELTLGAGVYTFYEESRPYQQGKIIVDPRAR